MLRDCSTWNSAPSDALWYGCVVFGLPGQDTTYNDAYSANDTDLPDLDLLVPDGAYVYERQLTLTHKGMEVLGIDWQEDQIFPSEF